MLFPRTRMTSAGFEIGPHVPANGRYGCFVNRSGAGLHRVVTVWPPGGWGTAMTTESLTYSELGDRLGCSPEAARSLARRLRLLRKPGNDGKVRAIVDLAEIQYKPAPARSPDGPQADNAALNARIEQSASRASSSFSIELVNYRYRSTRGEPCPQRRTMCSPCCGPSRKGRPTSGSPRSRSGRSSTRNAPGTRSRRWVTKGSSSAAPDDSYRLGRVLVVLGRRTEEATGLDRAEVLLEAADRAHRRVVEPGGALRRPRGGVAPGRVAAATARRARRREPPPVARLGDGQGPARVRRSGTGDRATRSSASSNASRATPSRRRRSSSPSYERHASRVGP